MADALDAYLGVTPPPAGIDDYLGPPKTNASAALGLNDTPEQRAQSATSASGITKSMGRMMLGGALDLGQNLATGAVKGAGNLLDDFYGMTYEPNVGAGEKLAQLTFKNFMPAYQPQTLAGRAVQGAGEALPLAALTGVRSIPELLAQGAGGEFGGEIGQGWTAHPEAGRLLGSLVGGGTAGVGTGAVTRGVNAARGVTSPTTAAYDRLKIPTDLAGDVTGNPFLQSIQAMGSQSPAGGKINAAAGRAVDAFGNAVERTAAPLGTARTMEEAGAQLQDDARNWVSRWKAGAQRAWNTVDLHIPGSTPVDVSNYKTTLESIKKTLPDAPATADVLQPALSKNLLDSLTSDLGSGSSLSWQSIKGIRTRIGEMLESPSIVADTSTAELKRLYGALSEDMRATAAARGAPALDAFNRAADITKGGHFFIDNAVSKILGSDKAPVRPGDAVNFALQGAANDGTRLGLLRAGGLDRGVDSLAAWKLRDMALAQAGKQGSAGETISPGTFLTDANKLSPGAEAILFNRPTTASNLADLKDVAARQKETTEHVNTSRTGPYASVKSVMETPTAAIHGAGLGYAVGGIPGALIGAVSNAAGPFMPGFLAGNLTATPWLSRLLATPGTKLPLPIGLVSRTQPGLLGPSDGQ